MMCGRCKLPRDWRRPTGCDTRMVNTQLQKRRDYKPERVRIRIPIAMSMINAPLLNRFYLGPGRDDVYTPFTTILKRSMLLIIWMS